MGRTPLGTRQECQGVGLFDGKHDDNAVEGLSDPRQFYTVQPWSWDQRQRLSVSFCPVNPIRTKYEDDVRLSVPSQTRNINFNSGTNRNVTSESRSHLVPKDFVARNPKRQNIFSVIAYAYRDYEPWLTQKQIFQG